MHVKCRSQEERFSVWQNFDGENSTLKNSIAEHEQFIMKSLISTYRWKMNTEKQVSEHAEPSCLIDAKLFVRFLKGWYNANNK